MGRLFINGAMLAILLLGLVGWLGTWQFSFDNGANAMFTEASTISNPTLPGTNIPMRENWTGIAQVDETFRLFLAIFWPIFNGGLPELSLMSFHFYGQMITVWMLILVEGFRVANTWRLISLYAPLFMSQSVDCTLTLMSVVSPLQGCFSRTWQLE